MAATLEDPAHEAIVVVVDDEEMVTTSLSSYLSLETNYEVYPFVSPKKALDFLHATVPDVIIADFLMPEIDGLQLLARARQLCPDVTAILLTGYADKENAIKAINEVGIFQYIEKPWDNEHLKLVIRNGITQKRLRRVLEEKLRELDTVLLEKAQLAEHTEMLKEELRLAQKVQQSMLPHCFPEANGFAFFARYEPALEVGGDFYDVIPLAGERLALLLADVTGHGIQAALLTVLLKVTFATFQNWDVRPGEILSYMNGVIHKILPKGHFVAGTVAQIEPRRATCTVVNAGIPHPYVLRRKSNAVERIPANGLLLGVAPEELYVAGEEVTVSLEPGDRLVFLTDGLTEAENERGELFETKCLVPTLRKLVPQPIEEMLEALTRAAQSFSKADHKWDDVTIVAIEKH